MRSTSRSKCSRTRGSPRAPSGDSSSTSSAESNSCLARSRCPERQLLLAGLEMTIRTARCRLEDRILGTGRARAARRQRRRWRRWRDLQPPLARVPEAQPATQERETDGDECVEASGWACPLKSEQRSVARGLSIGQPVVNSVTLRSSQCLRTPSFPDKDLGRLAGVSRGGRDDGPLAHQDLPSLPSRRPHIVFADERDRRGGRCLGAACRGAWTCVMCGECRSPGRADARDARNRSIRESAWRPRRARRRARRAASGSAGARPAAPTGRPGGLAVDLPPRRPGLGGLPDVVGHPLDVQQVPRRDVVRRDVAAEAAAAQRHRRDRGRW